MKHPATLLALLALSSSALAQDWPRWRGPERSGISPATGWTSEGAEDELWRVDVGRGYSSPSIAGGKLYTRGYFEGEGLDVTSCLDALSGEELWTHASPAKLWDNMHGGGTLTTPVVEGDTVYVLCRMGELFALDAESGEVKWERQLAEELEVGLGPFGLCSSPLVLGERVHLNVGKTVALDAASGETIWETGDYGPSYATPEPFEWEGLELLAVFNAAGLTVLDRADGSEVALHPWTSNYNVNSASPIVMGNRIFISTGYNDKGCALLELGDEGLDVVWAKRFLNTKMNGCVLVDELLYGFDGGELMCVDLEGEVRWKQRGLGIGTVIASDGRLIVLSEEGELLVAPAGGEAFEPETRRKVFEAGPCWTTPVLANGLIYLRSSAGELVCLDHRAR